MTKVFSTKLDEKTIKLLDGYCKKNHLKKSRLLEDLIEDGIKRRSQTMNLAESIRKGLEQAESGDLYTADEAEALIFRDKKDA